METIVTMAIMSIVTAASMPMMISYWRSAALRSGAEELAAGLNSARQLAISQSQSVCVEVTNNKYRFRLLNCTGTVWKGPGSDANGYFKPSNDLTLSANANPLFNYLGAASAATLTVTNPVDGSALGVVVSPAGRVRICPATGCTS
jgi:Tfp pilus assembly protein FimT